METRAGHSPADGANGYPVPVLFLVFNRPATTARVFEAIRRARPTALYIAADGPRADRPAEADLCRETRRVADRVDWPCRVQTLFRDTNLGCRNAVSSAIDWFFENVEAGIVLEDDCVPHEEFFVFCRELLARYESDTRVMHIAGTNRNPTPLAGGTSYTFSKFTPIWGWASWRRAWKHYDADMGTLDEFRRSPRFRTAFSSRLQRLNRITTYELVRQKKIDTWDYQWNYAIVANDGLAVVPARGLVTNIGIGEDATHTRHALAVGDNTAGRETLFPLRHPPAVEVDRKYDRSYYRNITRVVNPIGPLLIKRWLTARTYAAIRRRVAFVRQQLRRIAGPGGRKAPE